LKQRVCLQTRRKDDKSEGTKRRKQDNTNQKKIRLKRRQTEDAMKPSFTSASACVPCIAFVRKEANKGSHRLQIREKEARKTN
jgi:hypothetical protein